MGPGWLVCALFVVSTSGQNIQSFSYTSSETECVNVSTHGGTESVLRMLIEWQQKCGLDDLPHLSIGQTEFNHLTIPTRWLHLADERSIRVHNLTIDMQHVAHINSYAFATKIFTTSTKSLLLLNLHSNAILAQSLSGLTALADLRIESAAPLFIPACLCGVSSTVTALRIHGPPPDPSTGDQTHSINALTATILARVQLLDLRFNMRDTIDEYTFLGMASVQVIRLVGCQIAVIGANAFYPVRRTLRSLELSGNRLSRLPMAVLGALLPSPVLRISLHDNPWQCDCRLFDLQTALVQNGANFERQPVCESPAEYGGRSVAQAQFCSGVVNGTDEEEVTSTTDEVAPSPEMVVAMCDDGAVLQLHDRVANVQLLSNGNGTLAIRVQRQRPTWLYIQRTYGSRLNETQLHRIVVGCPLIEKHGMFGVTELCTDVVQLFCVGTGEESGESVSAFDCLTTRKRGVDIVTASPVGWIGRSWKMRLILVVFLGFLLNITVGVVIGYVVHSAYGKRRMDNVGVVSLRTRESIDSIALHTYDSIETVTRFEIVQRELQHQRSLDEEAHRKRMQQRMMRTAQSS